MNKELSFMPQAWDDYLYWQTTDKKSLKRINALFRDKKRDAFFGIGKPEPLKGEFSGYWSRRIGDMNRVIYRMIGDKIIIIACRGHCGD